MISSLFLLLVIHAIPTGLGTYSEDCLNFKHNKDFASIVNALIIARKTWEEAIALQVEVS